MKKEEKVRSRYCVSCGQPESAPYGLTLDKVKIGKGDDTVKFYLCETHTKALKQMYMPQITIEYVIVEET